MNTDLVLKVLLAVVEADKPRTQGSTPPVAAFDSSGYPVSLNGGGQQYEHAAVGATLMQDDFLGEQEQPPMPAQPHPREDQLRYMQVNAPYCQPTPESPAVVVKLASPDLGTGIPMEWLDPVDALYDALKDNAVATTSLDAMILNWLKIKRYEPKPGDKFVSSNDQTEGGEIGFVIERLIKRGYEYVGTAIVCSGSYGHSYGRGYGKMRRAVVKLANGLTPPPEQPSSTVVTPDDIPVQPLFPQPVQAV